MPNIRALTPELAKIAAKECNETPERMEADLVALKEWLIMSPHLNACTDDQFLVAFLRGCKYSLERVKEKLDIYYTMRTAIPELMENRDPLTPKIMNLFKLGVALPLANTVNPDSPYISLYRTGIYDSSKTSLNELLAYTLINTDYAVMHDDINPIAGQIIVFDLENVSMQQILEYTPLAVKRILLLFQEAAPIRNKGVHYINAPAGMATVFGVMKSMLSEKLKNRVHIHKSLDELFKHVPQRIFPKEYGGEAGPISDLIVNWEKLIVADRDKLIASKQYGVDEKKRQGKSRAVDWIDGVEGSFRKLIVD